MKKPISSRIGFLGLVILAANSGIARAACPPLLILERSVNRNRVWYQADESGSAPGVSAKWEMREKGPGVWEDLTTLERNKAYGPRPRLDAEGPGFSIAGVPSVVFRLDRSRRNGCSFARATGSDGTEISVERIQLVMKRTLVPSIEQAWFVGTGIRDGLPKRLPVRLK
jgi:hypothetical protein